MSPFFIICSMLLVSSQNTIVGEDQTEDVGIKNNSVCWCGGLEQGSYCGHELIKHAKMNPHKNLSNKDCERDGLYYCFGNEDKAENHGICSQNTKTVVKYCCVKKASKHRHVECMRNYTVSPTKAFK